MQHCFALLIFFVVETQSPLAAVLFYSNPSFSLSQRQGECVWGVEAGTGRKQRGKRARCVPGARAGTKKANDEALSSLRGETRIELSLSLSLNLPTKKSKNEITDARRPLSARRERHHLLLRGLLLVPEQQDRLRGDRGVVAGEEW